MWRLALCFLIACGPARATAGDDDGQGHPDGGGKGGDGGGSDRPDGGMPVMCGGSICRADQACNAGVCEFACQGATVPGDYATIQAAIDALAATGNDATICLGPNTYAEGSSTSVRDPGAHGKALRIIGPAMDRTRVQSEIVFYGNGWHALTLQGFEVGNTSTAIDATFSNNESLTVIGMRIKGSGLAAYQRGTVLVDGSVFDVSNNQYGVQAYVSTNGPLAVTIQNSSFKSAYTGLWAELNGPYPITASFVNNVVLGCRGGVHFGNGVMGTVSNSIFTGTGLALEYLAGSTVTNGHNALWGNTTNYAGIAADGAGYVKQDCMLDLTGPAPALRDGSPCMGAGDPAGAPNHDFYGAARGSSIDIGAVQH